MKKLISLALAAAILLTLIPFSALADTVTTASDDQGFEYALSDDGTYYIISGYTGSATSVTIPSEYAGLPIKAIGAEAFNSSNSITSMQIPESVTSIGDFAFIGCDSLTDISIPNSIETLGDYAFMGLGNLAYNEYENGKYLGNSGNPYLVFAHISSASAVSCTIHDNTKFILSTAFYCSEITEIVIPDSVTAIGCDAFYDCYYLSSVTLGEAIRTIGDYAFDGCSQLTKIEIPASVVHIGIAAFAGCNIENLSVSDNNTIYHGSDNCIIETAEKALVVGCKNSVIPSDGTVTRIGDFAFYECRALANITIPDCVTKIGYRAFGSCTSLTNIIFSGSTEIIGDKAFDQCSSLSEIIIPDSVIYIGDHTFSDCISLTSISIPDGIEYIGDYAFAFCDNLSYNEFESGLYIGSAENPYLCFTGISEDTVTECNINENTRFIIDNGNNNLTNLTSLTIPDSVCHIGHMSFNEHENLIFNEYEDGVYLGNDQNPRLALISAITDEISAYTVNENTRFILDNAFLGSDIQSIIIPESVIGIGSGAFTSCYSLKSINIPNSVKYISGTAFWNCNNIVRLVIPDSVKYIGNAAFAYCYSLTDIYFESKQQPNTWTVGIENWYDACNAAIHWGFAGEFISLENNVAAGKSYTSSVPFKWNENDDWQYDENGTQPFPDTGNKELTNDIVANDGDYNNIEWVGYNFMDPEIAEDKYAFVNVDLGATYDVTKIQLYVGSIVSVGITVPKSVGFYGYIDGDTEPELIDTVALSDSDTDTYVIAEATLDAAKQYRNVEVRLYQEGAAGFWIFVGEIVVIGTEHTSHTAGETWESDATSHWNKCGCSEKINIGDHIAGDWVTVTTADVDTEGLKELHCSVCDYLMSSETIPATHEPETNAWFNDSNSHWQECGCGEKINIGDHIAGDWVTVTTADVDTEGLKELHCSVCGYLMSSETIPATHKPETNAWFNDSNSHWQECGCGEKINIGDHIAGDWVTVTTADVDTEGLKELHCSVCDYLMSSETIPATKANNQPQINISGNINININGDVNVNDEQNNINININIGNAFDSDTTINIGEITAGEMFSVVSDVLQNTLFRAFDFTATKDGKYIQPKETFTVDFDIPEAFSDDVSIFYVSPDGKTEEIPSTVNEKERTVTAEISHFSTYVLVDNAAKDPNGDKDEIIVLGDVNLSGAIDMLDYILLKRAYFGTYTLNDTAEKCGDVNRSGDIDMLDYILLKRAYFGTYTIE